MDDACLPEDDVSFLPSLRPLQYYGHFPRQLYHFFCLHSDILWNTYTQTHTYCIYRKKRVNVLYLMLLHWWWSLDNWRMIGNSASESRNALKNKSFSLFFSVFVLARGVLHSEWGWFEFWPCFALLQTISRLLRRLKCWSTFILERIEDQRVAISPLSKRPLDTFIPVKEIWVVAGLLRLFALF